MWKWPEVGASADLNPRKEAWDGAEATGRRNAVGRSRDSAHLHGVSEAGTDTNSAPIVLARERPFRLGAVSVRPAKREIVGPLGREVLEPRVMEVLVALARAKGETVTRDELIASCWEGRVVGEDAITRVISRLRRHAEGVGRDGWTMETVTKVGYRLLPVGGMAEPAAEDAVPSPSRRRWVLAGAGAAAVVAGGSVAGLAWRARKPPATPEAQALYEKGREALRQGLPEPTAQAIGFLREAVAESPDFADAWGELSSAYQHSVTYTEPPRQAGVVAQAEAAARRAQELDPEQPVAAATLALLVPVYRNWDKAEPLFLKARKLHPREPNVLAGHARMLLGLGRIKEAVAALQISVAADAYVPPHRQLLAMALWADGRMEEADLAIRKALALWPRHYALWFLRFYILAHSGRAEEALAFAADKGARPPNVPAQDLDMQLAGVRALQSRSPADVDAAAQTYRRVALLGVGYAELAVRWFSTLGLLDDAFTTARGLYLNEGFRVSDERFSAGQGRFMQGGARMTHHLFLPPTAAMRADPRFGVLMRDIGIAAYWKASGHGPDNPAWARGA